MDVNVRPANVQSGNPRATSVSYTIWGDESDKLLAVVSKVFPEAAIYLQTLEQEMAYSHDLGISAEYADLYRSVASLRHALWEGESKMSPELLREILMEVVISASLAIAHLPVAGSDVTPEEPEAATFGPVVVVADAADEQPTVLTNSVNFLHPRMAGQAVGFRQGGSVRIWSDGGWHDELYIIKDFLVNDGNPDNWLADVTNLQEDLGYRILLSNLLPAGVVVTNPNTPDVMSAFTDPVA